MNKINGEKSGMWRARLRMVEDQLRGRDIDIEAVLAAMNQVPREAFVSEALQDHAYDDNPLPIGEGQTISQPYMVALMTQLLDLHGHEKVLEIGTGSGYQSAVLAELSAKVFSIERSYALSQRARKVLEGLGYHNILLRVSDGSIGWEEFAPYDRIIVTAAAPQVPKSLVKQLADDGIMIVPVGNRTHQELKIITKTAGGLNTREGEGCIFVPLVGREGWREG